MAMKVHGLTLLAVAMLLGCQRTESPQPAQSAAQKPPATTATTATTKETVVSVTDVLGWRSSYGDLLGKPKAAAVERFGEPSTQDRPNVWTWEPSAKTSNRMVTIFFAAQAPNPATEVKVYASDQEKVDPLEVLKRAPQFDFTTGTYRDSVTNYLIAETKDGRNDLQFDIDGDVVFSAATFRGAGATPAQTSQERGRRK